MKQLNRDQIQMSLSLLLFTFYYPEFPPLRSFTALAFKNRKDIIVLVEDGTKMFVDIQNATQAQQEFFNKKIEEERDFRGAIENLKNNYTRFSVQCI